METPGGGVAQMKVTELDFGDWLVTTFEAPVPGRERSFDRIVAMETTAGMALSVVDAAVNLADPLHVDKTERALRIVVNEVITNGIAVGIGNTAMRIHDPEEPYRHRSAMLAFAGAQFGDDGTVEAFRCGDAEIWARYDDVWLEVLPGDTMTEAGRSAFAAVVGPGDTVENWLAQERALDDLGLWQSPPIGLDRVAHARRRFISGADEVVITTDGAQLNPERLANLEQWLLQDISVMPPNHPYPAAHGDVSVIRASRSTADEG